MIVWFGVGLVVLFVLFGVCVVVGVVLVDVVVVRVLVFWLWVWVVLFGVFGVGVVLSLGASVWLCEVLVWCWFLFGCVVVCWGFVVLCWFCLCL
ncbi:hypothetical protein [Neisseria sp. P0018.S006]|uniref:hypothetical protein n=1 Tax=Neisseria sp. P0018.S006 TaxID=3436792 RepID=UPI003F7D60A8